ncbi:hypothetical protein TGAMA5MH_04866 [Trichoderma gamsii]|uniref:Uncharacterized protein n=1 Tax=Trichoderma gamsii TaxID=398673 RepID=A0A2K0TD12_9HYPO|nr:hypothetical protein TGAMA5MH_04866 [Trichoderma gamsii]
MDDKADFCFFSTTHSLCCDPGEGYGSGILPVELDRLFPESDEFTADDVPNFSEAFYQNKAVLPQPLYSGDTNNPNTSPFAWVIMVGCPDDVQSLDKRDGSHLDVFDCPDTHPDDFSVQSLRAVCTEESPDNNCQDILLGGAENTVLRLPPDCGPDVYVRVVSFSRLENATAPAHLTRHLVNNPKVYEIRYDYDFGKVREKKERQKRGLKTRADGCGDIYFRVDSSDQQNYWHEIVQSSPQGKVRKRSPQDWRQFHLDWFEQHGFMNNTVHEDRVGKRGYGDDSWWKNLFNKLANQQLNQPYEGSTRYGIYRYYPFSQMLYNARRSCPPNADASIEAKVEGSFEANLGFGLSLVGTLTNFNLDDAYAYFVLDDANAFTKVSITGQAAFTISSGEIPLLENFAPWGGSFNIKGIATVGPFLDITAQLQSLATLSGSLVGEVLIATDEPQVFMYPTSLGVEPDPKYFSIYNIKEATKASAGVEANVAAEGHVVVKLDQSAAFKIQVHFLSSDLVNTDIRATYSNSMNLGIGAGASSGSDKCSGIWYWMNWASSVTLKMLSPLPNWAGGNVNNKLFDTQVEIISKTCYSWSESKDRRELSQLTSDYSDKAISKAIFNATVIDAMLVRRADVDDQNPLFPDPGGSCLRCATDTNTPLGECDTSLYGDDGSEPLDCPDPSTSAKRTLERGLIQKRGKKDQFGICKGVFSIGVNGISFPDSKALVADGAKEHPVFGSWTTWAPDDRPDCDNMGFNQQSNPAPGDVDTSKYGTEHILEWQILQRFLQSLGSNDPAVTYDNCASDDFKKAFPNKSWNYVRDSQTWTNCEHLRFWWGSKAIPVPWYTSADVQFTPMSIMGQAIPNNENSFDEFQLLDSIINSAKQAAWSFKYQEYIQDYSKCIKAKNWAAAMNKVRFTIWTLKYTKATEAIFKAQATRVGDWLDKSENALAAVKDTSWNKCQYKKLDLGDKWRRFIYSYTNTVIDRFTDNIKDGIKAIEKALNIDDDGDTDMGGTTTGASEQNKDLLDRLDKIKDLWNEVGAWTNPLPAEWV